MIVCDRNICFTLVLAEWECTANDVDVFDQAITITNFNFLRFLQGVFFCLTRNDLLY